MKPTASEKGARKGKAISPRVKVSSLVVVMSNRNKVREYLLKLSMKSEIAIDAYYKEKKYDRLSESNVDILLSKKISQLFIESREFPDMEFLLTPVRNKYIGDVYVISRHGGDGHIQMTIIRESSKYYLSANTVDFSEYNELTIRPSKRLKLFLSIVRKDIRKLNMMNDQ